MYSIKNNRITLTRGDTLIAKVLIKKDGEEYIPSDRDEIRFAMKKNYLDSQPLILKPIPSDTQILRLDPEDTKPLPFNTKYVYDIQITFANGIVDTFVKGDLTLTEEVD